MKNKYVATVKDGDVYIGQKKVFSSESGRADREKKSYAYNDLRAGSDDYELIGIHGSNPGNYKYLDSVLVVDKKTEKHHMLRLWPVIGGSHYGEESKLQYLCNKENVFYASSSSGKAVVRPDFIFTPPMAAKEIVSPALDINKPETYFDYENCDNNDIIISLKKEVPRTQLLRLPGFNLSYNLFKFERGVIDYGYLLFVDTDTNKSWQISWGSSTSMVCDTVWDQRDFLVECMKKVIPNHPRIRESVYVEKIA